MLEVTTNGNNSSKTKTNKRIFHSTVQLQHDLNLRRPVAYSAHHSDLCILTHNGRSDGRSIDYHWIDVDMNSDMSKPM